MSDALRQFKSEIFQGLAHPTRIAIVELLREGELSAGSLIEKLRIEQANASQHLAVLRAKQIVVSRKVGNQVYYSIRDHALIEVLDILRRYFYAQLNNTVNMLKEVASEQPKSRLRTTSMTACSHPRLARLGRLRRAVEQAAHLLPMQGPIGVFVHHNTLHAFEHLSFEEAVIQAAQLFDADPYMSEAAYRAELAQGRIQLVDVDAVLDREPDSLIFARLSRGSLRRAMITPGVREFDGATIIWRTEQGDLAKDFRRPALRALFDACFARAVAHEEEPTPPRPVDEVIHPWLIRLCSVFLDQGTAYWPMPNREKGFYECVRTLFSCQGGMFPKYLVGLDDEFGKQECLSFSASDAVLDYLDSQSFREAEWPEILQAELLALPGWAGLMHRLEKDPALAPHKTLPCSLDGLLSREADDVPRSTAQGSSGGCSTRESTQDAREEASEPVGAYL